MQNFNGVLIIHKLTLFDYTNNFIHSIIRLHEYSNCKMEKKFFATGKLLAGLKIEKIYLKIKAESKQIKSNVKEISTHKI